MLDSENLYWRVSLTEANLPYGFFWMHRLPPPISVAYLDYSVKVDGSDGRQNRQGYNRATMQFDTLSSPQLHTLMTYADKPNKIYFTIRRDDGTGLLQWIDIEAWFVIPDRIALPYTNGLGYRNLIFTLNNVVTVNDPSTALP